MGSTSQTITMPILGLSSGGGGALAAERALANLAGVTRAYVNPLTEMAYVEFDPGLVDQSRMIAVLERAGLGVGHATLRWGESPKKGS